MSSQLVSLVWDGHHTLLVSVFEKLLVNSHIVDCTIAAGGQKMTAHKEVLSAFSPFFELLFREETETNPTVIISGISFRDLRSLVDFMYQGKLEVTEERIQDLIDAAECLQIKGLGGRYKENDSGNINNTKALPKRPAFSSDVSRNLTRKCQRRESASVGSKESEVNNLIDSNEIQPENSVVTFGAKKSSLVQNVMSKCDKPNLSTVSNIPLIPVLSTLSDIEMGSSHLQGEYVAAKEPDSVGDEIINEPMRVRNKRKRVCENSRDYAVENAYECSGEESILGLSADISVPNEDNVYEDLPLDCIPPAVLSAQLCNRDLIGSCIKNELSNIYMNSSSESVDPLVSAVDTQDPLFHSEFLVKSEDETRLSVDKNLRSGHDEFSENVPKNIGFPLFSKMQKKVECTEKNSKSSGAAPGCILELTYSEECPAVSVKVQRIGRNEPPVGLIPTLPAEVSPHDIPTQPSHTTPACERDTGGPIRRAGSNGSISTDQQYLCQICGKTFARNRHLNIHMRIHAKDILLRNGKCNNAAVTSIKLNKQRTHCEPKVYKCTACEFKSAPCKFFQVHSGANPSSTQRINIGVKPFKCTECEFTSAKQSNLMVHQRSHSKVKPYKCVECDYTSTQIGNLNRHQRTHSGLKPYKCTECDYSAVCSGDVNKHQRIHSRVKPYKCAECDYTAARISHLKSHQMIHSGRKPYKCTECDYTAARISHLKSHQIIHSDRKPYKCTECDYTTAYICNLQTHLRIHSGVKTYKCSECNYASRRRDELKSHQRTHSIKKP